MGPMAGSGECWLLHGKERSGWQLVLTRQHLPCINEELAGEGQGEGQGTASTHTSTHTHACTHTRTHTRVRVT